MRIRTAKKTLPGMITIAIILIPVVFVLASSSRWDLFTGSTSHNAGGKHNGNGLSHSASGYLGLTLNRSSNMRPSTVFQVAVGVVGFTEDAGGTPELLFNNRSTNARINSNNSLFNIIYPKYQASQGGGGTDPYYKPTLNAGGNSVADSAFTLQAPATAGSYTLRFDALDAPGGSGSTLLWAEGSVGVTIDNSPPTISNLVNFYDPLEGGNTQRIWVNVSDNYGVDKVWIRYDGVNYSMIKFPSGNIWEYWSWAPSTVGVKSYTIYANDTAGWNATLAGTSFTVQDTTAPSITNLVKIPNPLELGNTETVRVNVSDWSSIPAGNVSIEIAAVNYTMTFISGNMYQYPSWSPSTVGTPSFKIWANDSQGNTANAIDSIDVLDTTAPGITNLVKIPAVVELGQTVVIRVNVTDLSPIPAGNVKVEIGLVNYSMTLVSGDMYEYASWQPPAVGSNAFKIWAGDNQGNWVSQLDAITVQDTIAPGITNLVKIPAVVELGQTVVIRVNVTDQSPIPAGNVKVEIGLVNYSMTHVSGDMYEYASWQPPAVGSNAFKIWAGDNQGNWASQLDAITVQDTTAPTWSNKVISNPSIDLGATVSISIDVYDSPGAGVSVVKIEFDGTNHTMVQVVNTWSWTSWKPTTAGIYNYVIYMSDGQGNLATTTGSIQVNTPANQNPIDDTPPPVDMTYTIGMASAGIAALIAITVVIVKPKKIKGVKRGNGRLRFPLR